MAATISIECVHCHKRYNAPATMASKKVKCKHCGKVFAIPGDSTEQTSDPNLSSVGADAAAGAGAPLPTMTSGGGKAGSRTGGKLGSASAGYASKMARGGDVEEIDFAKSSGGAMLRPTIPHEFPGAAALDGLAPVLLVAIGLGLLAWSAFGFTSAAGVGWVGPVRLIAYLGLCTGLAFPLGYMAVRSAARKCRFMMPPGSAMRAMGTFAFPFALALWMWLS